MAPEGNAFHCQNCSKVFKRAEHLRRHSLIHNQNRPFRCETCSKDFLRRDALQRHEQTHSAAPSLLQRGGRACSSCAAAKARCSGDLQCSRCHDRQLPCIYPVVGSTAESMQIPSMGPLQNMSAAFGISQSSALTPGDGQTNPHIAHTPIDFEMWDSSMLSATNWLDAADFLDFPIPPTPESAGYLLHAGQSGQPAALLTQPIPTGSTLSSQPVTDTQAPLESPRSTFTPGSAALTDGHTSNTSYEATQTEHGEFYVDGEPSRLPRVKRRKTSSSVRRTARDTTISRFSLQAANSQKETEPSTFNIEAATYDQINGLYIDLCTTPSLAWTPFEPGDLPPRDVFDYFLTLYMRHFDQSLPFLHASCFTQVQKHVRLVLALAAIGSQYAEGDDTRLLSVSMHEFGRRLLLHERETGLLVEHGSTFFDRAATFLHIVGMAYSGNDRLMQRALDQQGELRKIFLQACQEAESSQPESSLVEISWSSWCRQEAATRQAYCTWLIDCMWTYHFDRRPAMSLADGFLPLPCSKRLWLAQNEGQWKTMGPALRHQSTLQQALQQLYIDKQLSQDRGEFARVLIIHGLFHRLSEVEKYFENPLSHWEPTAHRQSSEEFLPQTPIWLPATPTFARWQNSACDCLDVLHWQANAKIGIASGLEHPTVLHLHLARIVLLAPFKEIRSLVSAMTKPTPSTPNASISKQLIQRWAIQHQYKARLAAIHAGVVFWHVRRYSIDGFYEAPAVALASLVLWAFGTFANRHAHASRSASKGPNGKSQHEREDSDQSDEGACGIILLDRPTDDELVQQFIRNGHAMQAHITGVGDLYASEGPECVVRVGIKLLSSLRCWGVGTYWLGILQDLLTVLRKSKIQG